MGQTYVAANGNTYIDGLLHGGKWAGTVTYSFPDQRTDYESRYAEADAAGFGSVSLAQIQTARLIFEGSGSSGTQAGVAARAVEQFTNLDLVFAGTGNGDIRIAQSSMADPTAYAYLPDPNAGYYGGDIWFGTAYDFRQPSLGNYSDFTMMHEIGHALGLKHSSEAGGVSGVAVPADRDAVEFTVMSYRSYVGGPETGYTVEPGAFPQSFMMLDILALQYVYGADYTANAGNTTYAWKPSTGETFIDGVGQGAPAANRVFLTIWDGGGTDTYDFSAYSTDLEIDLRPGLWSETTLEQRAYLGDGQYANGSVYNAYLYGTDTRSLIENAKGGSGNDTIVGNSAANVVTGGAGDDFIIGFGGVDTAVIGANLSDSILRYENVTEIITSADGQDRFLFVENFQFLDGTINRADGGALVDDLFYNATFDDVYRARVDADDHYAIYGWREGRDPNSYFDTSEYLRIYTDVAAAGIDPLEHYHVYGWKEGRDPGGAFDTDAYLRAYQDVAAAGLDPLAHYLEHGFFEGRSDFGDGMFN